MLRKAGTLAMVAMLAAGCSVAKSSDTAEKEALERRVAELEQKLLAQAPASGGAPAPVAEAAPALPPRPRPVAARPAAAPVEPVAAPAVPAPLPVSAPPAPVRPTPLPAPPPLVIAEGTSLDLVLESALSSRTNQAGDRVVARIARAYDGDGNVALPGGSYLEGRVVEVRSSGRVKGKARLDVAFDHIVVRGQRHAIETSGLGFEADESHKRDAAMVAGGAAAGAIIGAITGGNAGKGAVLGGAAGGGAVLATKGKEIDMPAGSAANVRVTQAAVLPR